MEKKYSNEDITIVWKPDVCIHSTICWKGLLEVFNPRHRPWIKMENAATERIIDQVKQCPSGALSYYVNKVTEQATTPKETVTVAPVTIEVSANGPYFVKTECRIIHSDGTEEVKTGTIALCRCGASANKPYCDGNHRSNGFKG